MTDAERTYLKTHLDEVVVLETAQGDSLLVQILIVVDEGETTSREPAALTPSCSPT